MTNKFYFFRSFAPENGSGMDRLCIGTTTLKSRKLLSLLFVLILGIGQMWADNYTIAFKDNGSNSDGSTARTSLSDIVSSGSSYISSVSDCSKVYNGKSGYGVKMGASGSVGTLTLNFSNSGQTQPKKIIVRACRYGSDTGNLSYKINGGSAQSKTLTNTLADYEIEMNGSTTLTSLYLASSTRRIYIASVKVLDCVAPTAVVKGTVTSNSVDLTITDATDVGTYEVYYSTSSTAPSDGTNALATVNSKTPTVTGLNANTTYYLWVRSKCSNTSKSDWCALTGSSFKTSAAVSYTITAQSNNTDYGTVSLSGSVITGSPKSGYQYASPAYTVTSGTATVSQSGNAFTITPTSNCTIRINFEALPKYTVTLKDDDTELTQASYGASVTLPSRAGCAGYTFTGWSTTNNTSWTTTAPTIINAGNYTPTANIDLYPVYTKTEGATESWTKVTSAPSDWSGDYVILNSDGDHAMISDFHSGTSGEFKSETATLNQAGTQLTNTPSNKAIWIVAKNGNNAQYSFKNKSTGTYAKITGTNSTNAALDASAVWFTIESTGTSGVWDVASVSNSARCFAWYATNNSFRTYAKSTNNTGMLFKKSGGSTTYYISEPNCCTELGSINGSVSLTQTTAALEWADLEHVSSWAVKYKEHSAQNWSDWNGAQATANSKRSVTITNLSCGTAYDFKIAASAASGYCDAEEVLEDKSTTKWNITYTLTNTVNLSEGPAQGANACGEISATFSKNASYTFPDEITVTIGGNEATVDDDYLWDADEGTLFIDAAKVTGNVVIAIAGVAPANPIVTPDPTSLSFTQVKKGAAVPAAKDIAITGQNLTSALTVTSSNTDLYVVSVKSGSLTPDANKDASPVITVTPQEGITSTAGDKDATITISGGGLANSVVINVTFNVQETYTVNWYVNGTKIDANSKTDVTGTAVTAPSDFSSFTDCMDKEFMGWATAPIATSQNNAPEGMITNTSEMTISGNADYYAVFATLVSEGGYEKVTNTSVLTAGDKIVITNGGTKAMKAYVSGNNCSAASIELNAAGDKITSLGTEGACEFTLGGTVGAWTFFDGTYYLYDAGSSNNNHMKGKTTKDDACEWVISATSVTSRTNTAKPYMQYNSNSSIFSCYNNSQTNVTLYRKTSAEYSAYVTTCPHITNVALVAESAEHGSISFEKGGSAVTSVRTDGESPVEVDIVKDINDGYEITGLTLTSEDVTGATKNDALTKITIPAGAEGTLTVTPTITLIPKYSIAFAKGDPAVTGSAPSAIADQYAGTPITLPENTYTWADHKFDKWLVIYVDANEQIQEVAVSDNAFTMPAANVTITAQWVEYVTCAVNAYVNGTLNQTEEVQSETTLQLSAFGTPSAPAGVTGYTFAGWALSEESDDVASIEMLGASITPEVGVKSINIYAVFSRTGDEVTDVLTAADLAATNTTYTDFSNVQKLSAAKYAGNSARNSSGDIQMRSSNSNSGIVSTVSAGLVKSVTINVGSGTNTIDLYGSNIAYTAASDLYGNSKGTKIGSTSSTATITPTSEQLFTYVGIRSSNNSIYLSSVSITWQPNYYTTRPAAICDVTYALGGGAWKANEGCADTKVKGGQSYTICSYVPVREGYNFVKWQIGGQDASGEITINANTTITAVWVAKVKSNVTYAAGTGTGDAVVVSNVEEGTEVTIKAIGSSTGQVNFTKGGFDFVGWLYNGNLYKAGTSFEMPASAVTFVAQWKKQNITKMTLVTDVAQLVDGSKVVIAQAEITDDACKTMGAQGSNNRSAVASTVDGNVISVGEGTSEFTLVSLGNNLFAFQASNGNYLYAASSSNNYLREQATIDGNASWTISIASNGVATIKAQGANSHNWMQYNSGNTLFSCYENAQKDIAIYASVTSVTENANISDLGYVEGETVVASGSGVVLTIDKPTPTTSITASNGATVVVNTADAQAENITVEDGGTVEVAQDVTVETLVISTSLGSISGEEGNTGGKSGQVTGSGSINATGDVFIQIELTQDEKASAGWYAFSLPFKVDALNGVYFGDKNLQNEKDYAIMAWHGDLRAQGKYGWKKYREVMDPGVLYIITVGNTDYKTLRFKKVAGEAIVQAENDLTISAFAASGEGQQATDAGWNGIGNKSLQIMQQGSYSTMQFLDHRDNAFKARNNGDVNILVGSAFFVQYGSGVGQIVSMEASTSGSIALAPAREQESIEKTVFEAKLKNAETGKTEDNLFFTAREDALNEYEAGRDVTKMSMGEAKCAQMFIPAYGTKLCAADFPLVNNQATYPLTLTIPTTGTYSISIKENENANIYLTKNGAIIWNLTKSPYTVEMEEGATEGYGLMLVKRAPQDVEIVSGEASEAGVQKVVINDKVFILRGEKMYNVTGKAVR